MSRSSVEETLSLISSGIKTASDCYTTALSSEWKLKVSARQKQLERDNLILEPGDLNIVLFHVKIPPDSSKIKTIDIRDIDHNDIDYESLISFNIKLALQTNPRSRIFLITDRMFLTNQSISPRIAIIRLDMNAREPMFERVLSMFAYTESNCFDRPTVFLDSDAFLLRPIHNIFANNFDIGLTHRNIHGQMPINEGVIFANDRRKQSVRRFFESYMASYLAIEKSPELSSIYKNIRRWRGGQLSINSAARGKTVYQSGVSQREDETIIALLPCSKYNVSSIKEQEINADLRDRAAILHLKGLRKTWVSKIAQVTMT